MAAPAIDWTGPQAAHPARDAARRSMDAVSRGAKAEWLTLFAEDAVIEDPVGPSIFDPEGTGHHGPAGIAAFWDKAIAHAERITFAVRDSFAAGDEVANVGTITSYLPDGSRIDAEGVFVYRVGPDGLIRSMRAFWEFERAMGTLRPA
jgi:steroid delta-isomerase